MVTTEVAMDIFINGLRHNLEEIRRRDIDGGDISFLASQSYWIDYGWIEERWRDHGLPQISVFEVGGRVVGEGPGNIRYMENTFQVDIFASGRSQKQDLTGQIKKGLYEINKRKSMLTSGLKLDRLISEFDTIDDEILPQKVFRKQLSFRVYYHTSGA